MTNYFRNDGEMPPEIAARFPIVDNQRSDRENASPKGKRMDLEYPDETSVWLDMATGLVCLVIVALELFAEAPDTLPGKLLYAAGATIFLLVGLYFVGKALDKLRR